MEALAIDRFSMRRLWMDRMLFPLKSDPVDPVILSKPSFIRQVEAFRFHKNFEEPRKGTKTRTAEFSRSRLLFGGAMCLFLAINQSHGVHNI
jgi:hypothetical protein